MSILAKRDVIIIDPALVSLKGHHFQLNKTILQALAPMVGRKAVLAGTGFEGGPEASIPGCRIYPCLSGSFYDAGGSLEGQGASDALAAEIIDGIQRVSPAGEYLLLIHTADALIYPALCSALAAPALQQAAVVVSTPYDFLSMPNRRKFPRFEAAMFSLGAAGNGYANVRLGAETDLLAADWRRRLGVKVSPLELPVAKSIPRAKPGADSMDEPITIVGLGNARVEKGFQHTSQIVRAALDPATPQRFKFKLQVTPQIRGYAPECLSTLQRLEELEGPNCELIRTNPSRKEYLDLLRNADAILMPYDRQLYQVRGSGVAVEGVASGKAIFSFPDTFPFSLARQNSFALGLPADLEHSKLIELFDFVGTNWSRIRQIARVNSYKFRKANQPATFARRICDLADRAAHERSLSEARRSIASSLNWAFVS